MADNTKEPGNSTMDDAQNVVLGDILNELQAHKAQVQYLQASLDRMTGGGTEYVFDNAIRALAETMAPLGQLIPRRTPLDKADAARLRLLLKRLDRIDYASFDEWPNPSQIPYTRSYPSEGATP